MKGFSGESVHRRECFGEDDGRDGSWSACPPDLCEADLLLARAEAAGAEVARLQIALSLHPNTQAFLKQTELREAAEARVTELEAAGRQWLSETGPGQHVNTAKGRYMMQRALYPAALAAPTKEGT